MRIDKPTADEIRAVALDMRPSDYDEFIALSFANSREELAENLVQRLSGRPDVMVGALDEPICIGATIEMRPNVITLLFFATPRFADIGIPITRFIRQNLFTRFRDAGIHRIEALSIKGHDQAHRWLRTLGLDAETGELPSYGRNGEPFIQFAWTRPCT